MTATMAANDILAKICADKREELARRKPGQASMRSSIGPADAEKPRGFGRALMDASAAGLPG